jgi:hypothetical protein
MIDQKIIPQVLYPLDVYSTTTMPAAIQLTLALVQLRAAHPQWGWVINERGVLVGELREQQRSAIYATRGGGWYAAVSLGGDKDAESVAGDIVQAFEAARKQAEEAT